MELNERLRDARLEKNITADELAERIGVNRSTLFRYESGEIASIPAKQLAAIARELGISIDRLLYGTSNASIRIPILGEVRAGIPTEAIENTLGEVEIPCEWQRRGEYFALRIKGDSMAPRMHEGDVVVVRKDSCPESGDVVVAMVGADNATVKKYIRQDNGITLEPYNRAAYEPLYFRKEQVAELPVTILGVVEELRGKP
ncbi:MAG: XRE family transcriptional regulator [Oscillospiraceae bacterium]